MYAIPASNPFAENNEQASSFHRNTNSGAALFRQVEVFFVQPLQ